MFNHNITHCNRGAILFILDCSLSMKNPILFSNTEMPKIDAAAIIINHMIEELLARATRNGYVRDYYDIGAIGYSGSETFSLLRTNDYERVFMSTPRIADTMPQPKSIQLNLLHDDGSTHRETFNIPFWVEPTASGASPMYDAMIEAKNLVGDWCNDPKNKNSYPPIIFHISDGTGNDADDSELHYITNEIKKLEINGTRVLLFNVYLATHGEGEEDEEIYLEEHTFATGDSDKQFMYRISSTLPSEYNTYLSDILGIETKGSHRAVAFNISPISMLSLINIGTHQPIKINGE